MAFLRALGSFWATPQQPAAPSLVPSTSPLARLSRTEQRDQLLDQLAELEAELAADEEYVPQKRARFTVPEEEDSSEDLADDAPAPEKSNRERTIYEKVPEEKHIVVDGTAVTDPAVAAALKKLFAKDNAGYKPAKYYPNKAEARRVWVKCCLERNYGCPKACRIDFAGGKATIIPNNHDHEHPDRGSDELLNPKRGLSKIIKGLIDKHCENVSWCITDIMDHLKKKGALENYDEDPDHFLDKIKGYVKRKKAAVQGFKWRTSYAELKEAVEEMSKSDQDIEAMVMQRNWDTSFTFAIDVSAARKTNFFVSASVRSLANAMRQACTGTTWAAGDGTGRLNYESKSLVFVGTVDRAQHFMIIGSFLLSKGEATDEIQRGLLALQSKISVVHRAMLRLPAGKALYDAQKLGDGYWWAPKNTMNDNCKAFFAAWAELIRVANRAKFENMMLDDSEDPDSAEDGES